MKEEIVGEDRLLATGPSVGEAATSEQVELFTKGLCRHIGDYRKKQVWNRGVTGALRGSLIVAGVVTTVLLGLGGYIRGETIWGISIETLSRLSAFVLSAVVSGLTAWEAFSEHGSRWIRSRLVVSSLLDIKDDLQFALADRSPPTAEFIRNLFLRTKAVLNAESEAWASKRATAINQAGRHP